jgi:lysophospholipase L1-like esterase
MRDRMSPMRKVLANVFVCVAALVLTCAIIDAAAFFLVGLRSARHGMEGLVQFSPLVGHFHKPYAAGRYYPQSGRTGHRVEINSYGFADDERSVDKTRPRVALVGDSTTECWEVDPEDRPHRVLEDMLDGRFEVLNLGVRGFGTDQTYVLLRQVGVGFDPDIIIYTFCINDIADNAKQRAKPYFTVDASDTTSLIPGGYPIRCTPAERAAAQDRLWRYSLVYRTFSRGIARVGSLAAKSPERDGEELPLGQDPELRPYKTTYDDEDRRRWQVTRRLIAAMQDCASAHGARFLVVEDIYRPVLDPDARRELTRGYTDAFDFDKVTRLFEGFTRDRGIAFVSIGREAESQGLHAPELMPPSDTIHLNAAGIRFWCSAVSHKLESLGWLDAGGAGR